MSEVFLKKDFQIYSPGLQNVTKAMEKGQNLFAKWQGETMQLSGISRSQAMIKLQNREQSYT